MTDLAHWRYHLEARAILRAVRHNARGESALKVWACAPPEAWKWARSHPVLYVKLVEAERKELAHA